MGSYFKRRTNGSVWMTCCCRVAFFHSHPERADPLTRKDPPSNSNENDMSGSVSSACDVNKKKPPVVAARRKSGNPTKSYVD